MDNPGPPAPCLPCRADLSWQGHPRRTPAGAGNPAKPMAQSRDQTAQLCDSGGTKSAPPHRTCPILLGRFGPRPNGTRRVRTVARYGEKEDLTSWSQ